MSLNKTYVYHKCESAEYLSSYSHSKFSNLPSNRVCLVIRNSTRPVRGSRKYTHKSTGAYTSWKWYKFITYTLEYRYKERGRV